MSKQSIKINDDETVTVTLSTGATHTLREPIGKDLDGIGQDLIKIKFTDSVQKLVNRISTPQLTKLQYLTLSLSDIQVLNAAIDFFSAPPVSRAEIKEALAELGYLETSNTEQNNLPE